MANRWCDGFGRYGGTKAYMLNGSSGQAWAEVGDAFDLSSANPRTGSHHLRLTGGAQFGNHIARRVFGAPLTEVYLGFAMYCHSLPVEEPTNPEMQPGHGIVSLRDQSNNIQLVVVLGTDGALFVMHGDGSILGRSLPVIGAGAYQHIEVYAKAGNGTAGAIEIRVDEVTVLNLTGIDTVQSANVEFSQWAINRGYGATAITIDFADAYVNDTAVDGSGCDSFVGDVKSGVLMVNADTAQADFALSTGVSGYELLDEKPPSDADYISTSSATAQSNFGLENGPSNLSEILTVRPFVRAWKDDAGTALIGPSVISGATKAAVAAQPITTAPAYYDSNVPINPVTGVPWTQADLDAALHVVERTA